MSRSSFELASPLGGGAGTAFYAAGGDLTIEGSRVDIRSRPPLDRVDDAAARIPLSVGTPRLQEPRRKPGGGGVETTTTTSGRAGAGSAVVVVALVVDGNLVVQDTVFAGRFSEGDEEGMVVFEESGSCDGEHVFVVSKLQGLRFMVCNVVWLLCTLLLCTRSI